MKDIKISIIMPVHNSGKFLDLSINSVLNQTYKNIQFIIIDDNSTDNSNDIIIKYKQLDERIVFKKLESDKRGVAAARNKGLDLANGDYIAWIDSDDIYHSNFIEYMLKIALKYNCDIVECQPINFEDQINLNYSINFESISSNIEFGNGLNLLERFSNRTLQTSLWSKLFKKDLFDNFRFREGYIYEEPYFYFDYYTKFDKIGFLTVPLYAYRHHNSSIMKKFNASSIESNLQLQDFLLKKATELHEIEFKLGKRILGSLLNLWKRAIYNNATDKNIKIIENQIKYTLNKLPKYDFLNKKDKLIFNIRKLPNFYKIMKLFNKIKLYENN